MIEAISNVLGGYSLTLWIFATIVVFAAGVLRGFTGFGFALTAVPALTLFLDPREIVPATVIVQVLAGFQLSASFLRTVQWRSLALFLGGAMLGTPIGIYLLAILPVNGIRAFIGAVVLLAVFFLWQGFRMRREPPRITRAAIGALSGFLNGGTAMGGPPVIIYFLASPAGVTVGRASLLAYFFFLSLGNAAMIGAAGMMSWRVAILAALMWPVMAFGNGLGHRWFGKATDRHYRQVALAFLLAIAVAAVARALVGLHS